MSLSNTFEGGSDGTTLTGGSGGNTGGASGDFFDQISIGTNAIVQFSTAAAYEGSLGMRVATRATASVNAHARWNTSFPSATDTYERFFFQVGAIPTLNGIIFSWYDDALSGHVDLRLLNSGKLDIRANAATQATSTTVLSAATWYRIEVHVHADTVSGFAEVRIFTDPTSNSYDESFGASSTFGWSANVGASYPGLNGDPANWPSATTYAYYDAIVADATTWVGPLAGTGLTLTSTSAVSTAIGPTFEFDYVLQPTAAALSTAHNSAPTVSGTASIATISPPAARSTAVGPRPAITGTGTVVTALSAVNIPSAPVPILATATPGDSVIGGVLLSDVNRFGAVGIDDALIFRRQVSDVPVFAGAIDDTPGH